MDIAIVLFDGFDDLDAVGPFEVFGHARAAGASLSVGFYTLTPGSLVTSSHGMRVEPDGTLWDPEQSAGSTGEGADGPSERPHLVVVPGGGWSSGADASVRAEVERGDLPEAVAGLYREGSTVASVCTGGMVLAGAGLIEGRPAVTHDSALDELRDAGAEVVEARVVDDGDIVTAGGITAGLDLALHLVRREFGEDIADTVATEMEYQPQGTVYVA